MPAQNNSLSSLDKDSFYLLLNGDYPEITEKLNELGFNTILLDENKCLAEPIRKHADMQFITMNKRTFVLPESDMLISFLKNINLPYTLTNKAESKYPKDVLCNGKIVGHSFICNPKTIDKEILSFAYESGLNIIKVNQGYTGCSVAAIDDNSIITADKSIYEEAVKNNLDVLLISEGNIKLEGYNYGFIGGCSGNIFNKLIIFTGSLNGHPDKDKIRAFINKRNIEILELDSELTDIGGIAVIEKQ